MPSILMKAAQAKILSGEHAFKLYDTYGFPLELTKVVAHERGFTVDDAGFEREMERQRIQSGKKRHAPSSQPLMRHRHSPAMTKQKKQYHALRTLSAAPRQLMKCRQEMRCVIVVERTPSIENVVAR